MTDSKNSYDSKSTITINGNNYLFFDIPRAASNSGISSAKIPVSLKIIIENLIRNEDGINVSKADILAVLKHQVGYEINIKPNRVLLQDFTGVPVVVDLISMRSYLMSKGKNPEAVNPNVPVDLVIDHSLRVDFAGTQCAFKKNTDIEMSKNLERYEFLKWGEKNLKHFSVVPSGTGICHQINIEYIANVVANNSGILVPDSLVGTDSHTTMVNSMCVLGWGVGGIEAEAVMLGQYISMVIPEIVGVKLHGKLPAGKTATDLVLTITNILRKKGVVGKFVEFYGDGLNSLSTFDRSTVSNMAPEYGSTCGLFPADQTLLDYLDITGRTKEQIDIVEQYTKAQGFWRTNIDPTFSDVVEIDLSDIKTVIAGPKKPQEKLTLEQVQDSIKIDKSKIDTNSLTDGSIIIAAITSCTNTSNAKSIITAGLVARNAVKLGIKPKSWVKTSLAPGSKIVTDYLTNAGLQEYMNELGFNLVGYGCATCIGNSGPLEQSVHDKVVKNNLSVASVLSGNRNFEGRIHQLAKYNYIASPPLVIAFAIAGNIIINIESDPIAIKDGKKIYLSDIWPSEKEIEEFLSKFVNRDVFSSSYNNIYAGDEKWQNIKCSDNPVFEWKENSTYIKNPPYFDIRKPNKTETTTFCLSDAKVLALLGDGITTDDISPAGEISKGSPAAKYLIEKGISPENFNSYGSRRGNHDIMVRGTLTNPKLKNKLVDIEGGYTKHIPSSKVMDIFDAAEMYKKENTPLVIIAGKEYGCGSSRDWAAKGVMLLGVSAVIAESFERIHRSNLVGMGVLPLKFRDNMNKSIFDGSESISIKSSGNLSPNCLVTCEISHPISGIKTIELECLIFTKSELAYFSSGGILQYALADIEEKL